MYEGFDGYSSRNVQQYICPVCGGWHFDEEFADNERNICNGCYAKTH